MDTGKVPPKTTVDTPSNKANRQTAEKDKVSEGNFDTRTVKPAKASTPSHQFKKNKVSKNANQTYNLIEDNFQGLFAMKQQQKPLSI